MSETQNQTQAVKYQRGKIYKVISNETNMIYIGSTCSRLSQRMAEHRTTYKGFREGKYHYYCSFEILQHADAQIVLIENYPCNSKEELFAKENDWMNQFANICTNKQSAPTGLPKDQYMKQYDANRERWYCEYCDSTFSPKHKSGHLNTKKHKNKVQELEAEIDLIFS